MRSMPVITRSPRGPYFRNDPQLRLDALAGHGVEHLEALDVAFALEDPRDLDLQARRRHVHARVLGNRRVPDPRQHVCDRVGHIL